MEESAFEFSPVQVAETSRRFPASRLVATPAHPVDDLGQRLAAPGAEFGRHAWDEGGHL